MNVDPLRRKKETREYRSPPRCILGFWAVGLRENLSFFLELKKKLN